MKYKPDLTKSARRHLIAANALVATDRKDVAGYLYGIAAECAIKAMMLQAGISQLSPTKRREDPYYLHYPQLPSALRDRLKGRVSTPLLHIVNNVNFLEKWSTDMRYANGKEIKMAWVVQWGIQAKQAVNLMGT
jgi:hypothetical protein